MDQFILSWSNLFWGIIFVLAIYLILQFLLTSVLRSYFTGNLGTAFSRKLKSFILWYEPVAIIFILVIFVLINPALHGLLIGILFLLSYLPLRNYIDGRFFLLNHKIQKGQQIKVKNEEGILQKIGRLGVAFRTNEGSRFINYTQLRKEGYTLLKSSTTSGFHQLILSAQNKEGVDSQKVIADLQHKFLDCPYLDWTYKPEMNPLKQDDNSFHLKVLLFKDQHLNYLKDWMEENGFDCQLYNKKQHEALTYSL